MVKNMFSHPLLAACLPLRSHPAPLEVLGKGTELP